jgi:hypothetical protein
LQSMLVQRQVLLRCGVFDETLKVAEDTKLVYALALRHGYCVVNERHVTICRERDVPGLSDSIDALSAYQRHDCYIRVQSEAYWWVLEHDEKAASILRKNMLYFASRQAELACALGRADVAKRYAKAGLALFGTWKPVCRSLFILMAYSLAERKFTNKWKASAPDRPEIVNIPAG